MKCKRYLAYMLASVITFGCLAGCGGVTTDDMAAAGSQEDSKTETAAKAEEQENPLLDEEGNPSPFGRYKETVTLEMVSGFNPTDTLPEGQSTTDNYYTRYLKDNVNVEVRYKWQASTADYTQKFNLMLSSGDLPDIMLINRAQLDMLIEADMLEDLSGYMDTYLSDRMKEQNEGLGMTRFEAAKRGDKLYAYPNSNLTQYEIMWIRKDWLDRLGLEMPSTLEDVENAARAFVDHKMGGENTIGILCASGGEDFQLYNTFTGGNTMNLDFVFGAYQSFPGYWVDDADGSVVYGSITGETKNALAKLRQWYEDGILDQELGIRADATAAWISGQAGILSFQWWFGYSGFKEALQIDPAAEWKAFVIKDDEGKWNVKQGAPSNAYIAVRKGYEHPELALALPAMWLEYNGEWLSEAGVPAGYWPAYTTHGFLDTMDYCVGVMQDYMKDGIEEGVLPDFNPFVSTHLEPDLLAISEVLEAPYDDLSIDKWDTTHPRFERIYAELVGHGATLDAQRAGIKNAMSSHIYYRTKTAEQKWDNLWKKEQEAFMKIILGEQPLDYFDTFVKEWKVEGGDEITAEVQAYVSR